MQRTIAWTLLAALSLAGCGSLGRGGEGPWAKGQPALSAEAQSALKRWQEAHQGLRPSPGPDRAPFEALRALLLADSLDEGALREALAALPQPPAPPSPEALKASLSAAREAMSPAEREALAALLEAGRPPMGGHRGHRHAPGPGGHPHGLGGHPHGPGGHAHAWGPRPDGGATGAEVGARPEDGASGPPHLAALGLNAEQEALLAALNLALRPKAPAGDRPDPKAHGQMLAAFLRGQGELNLPPAPEAPLAFPVEELVALAKALSPTQRQALFAHGPFGGPGLLGHGLRGPRHPG